MVSVIMLNVYMLIVIMLSVMAPKNNVSKLIQWHRLLQSHLWHTSFQMCQCQSYLTYLVKIYTISLVSQAASSLHTIFRSALKFSRLKKRVSIFIPKFLYRISSTGYNKMLRFMNFFFKKVYDVIFDKNSILNSLSGPIYANLA